MPPSYTVATELPTYEEAERSKQEEMEQMEQEQSSNESLGVSVIILSFNKDRVPTFMESQGKIYDHLKSWKS